MEGLAGIAEAAATTLHGLIDGGGAPAVVACLWVIAASAVALLPMRGQMLPGAALLLGAPAILVWLGVAYGVWAGLAAALAVVSMFRRPLRALLRRRVRAEDAA